MAGSAPHVPHWLLDIYLGVTSPADQPQSGMCKDVRAV
jgi:hypothetical protein